MKRVVVLDYGSGNLRSAERALTRTGADVVVTADLEAAAEADGLVVPGVGAFAACMAGLNAVRGGTVVWDRLRKGRPVLGICVGMQVLYETGDEHGERTSGLGVLAGEVTRVEADVVPHMGWNTVTPPADSVLFRGLQDERFYFVHSYAARDAPDAAVTWATHGATRFAAAVERGPLSATQFHPEKSGDAGATLLANWLGSL
ncbi:MAG: imidazole glycerol phosphate synthase subunit HisH [Actinobacteria bacterium]|nr:imidazole glycerol phosphate synthase subunit HisH [Actinomycetota bacterium]MCA1720743.1 imidazole glycerol phosphate synthase subunit HisH [Actinomycetota bacterium]